MKHMVKDGQYARFSNTEAKERAKQGWRFISKSDYRRAVKARGGRK